MAATIEEMIDKIEMYVRDRQIGIAENLASEFLNDCSPSPLKQSGYSILSILMSYFEMIEQFTVGRQSKPGESTAFFVSGFKRVYPCTSLTDDEIRRIYKWIRCGMYHSGMTQNQTQLSRFFCEGFAVCGGQVRLNPGRAVAEIKAHFQGYICRLRNPSNCTERTNFQKLCTDIGVGCPVSGVVASPTGSTRTTPAPWEQG